MCRLFTAPLAPRRIRSKKKMSRHISDFPFQPSGWWNSFCVIQLLSFVLSSVSSLGFYKEEIQRYFTVRYQVPHVFCLTTCGLWHYECYTENHGPPRHFLLILIFLATLRAWQRCFSPAGRGNSLSNLNIPVWYLETLSLRLWWIPDIWGGLQ